MVWWSDHEGILFYSGFLYSQNLVAIGIVCVQKEKEKEKKGNFPNL